MIDLADKRKCVGCGACYNICPYNAISMKRDNEGFLYPVIDEKKCVKCGLCNKVCPAMELYFKPNTSSNPTCYAGYTNDKIRLKSASGGLFSLFAEEILNSGGYVCGAAFDNNWYVEHKITDNVNDLEKLRVSKYLQSNTKEVYKEIGKLLKSKKLVLFSGTPCQVGGLYGFLRKDYDNLLTIDVLCHGTPSPEVWKKYLKEFSNNEEVEAVNFRDKSFIDRDPLHESSPDHRYFTAKTKDNFYYSTHENSAYYKAFLNNLTLRPACSVCHFTNIKRQSDITLGDYHGYAGYKTNLLNKEGLSLILLNTEKAQKYFDKIKNKIVKLEEIPVKYAMGESGYLRGEVSKPHKNRGQFFKEFKDMKEKDSIIDLLDKNLGKRDVAIMNFSYPQENYGALLVAYAMEKAITKLGYNPKHINYIPTEQPFTTPSPFWNFRNNFLHLTDICSNKTELRNKLNNNFTKFVVGSDQIWRSPWHKDFIYYYDWVYGDKTLISYSASFGKNTFDNLETEKNYITKCLKRFDAISVRENSGLDILKNLFDINNGVQVVDPTMLLDANDYQYIIDNEYSKIPNCEYIAYYVLDEKDYSNINNPDILSDLKKKYKLIDVMHDDSGNYRTFGEFLNLIKNAKYVITSSFHGSVFSIIYQKQFLTITTAHRGNERIESLFNTLNIDKNRFYDDIAKINENSFSNKIDYDNVNKNLQKEINKGIEYLKNALQIKPNSKENMIKGIGENNKKVIKLFDIIPLLKIKNKGNNTTVFLFNIIPLFKLKRKGNSNKIYLLKIIPFLKIK